MPRVLRTAEQISLYLSELYKNEFGGKKFGKYKFSYKAALTIFDRAIIKQALINDINDYLITINDGYKLVQFEDEFAVFSTKYLSGLRPLPKKAWIEYSKENNIESTK